MIQYNESIKQIKIIIPVSSLDDLRNYSNSLLEILGKIEIDCDPHFKANLKAVYELLLHLQPDEDFLAHYKELLNEGSMKNLKSL